MLHYAFINVICPTGNFKSKLVTKQLDLNLWKLKFLRTVFWEDFSILFVREDFLGNSICTTFADNITVMTIDQDSLEDKTSKPSK